MTDIELLPLEHEDRNQFILDNQEAFRYGAMEEFGLRDDHFEEEGEIISRKTIEASIDGGMAYRIIHEGEKVGGLVVRVEADRGELELLFVKYHAKHPDPHVSESDGDDSFDGMFRFKKVMSSQQKKIAPHD